jgi:YebC/PmpR family DNA-binding regulatory protein
MSGHSKWSSIKHQKGVKDARRGRLFAKLIRAIEVAARTGGANPDGNPTLADAIQKAKDNSVPNDTIDRAVKRGAGELGGQQLELVTYEGYAPGGVAVLVEALTDNRNRTASAIRHAFTKGGGSMAEAGAVSYLFTRKGQIVILAERVDGEQVDGEQVDEERVMEVALEAGAEDVEAGEEGYTITTAPGDLRAVRAAFDAAGIAYQSAEVTMVPSVSVPLEREGAVKVLRLLDALEDLDDVQDVYANFDIPDEIMAEVS